MFNFSKLAKPLLGLTFISILISSPLNADWNEDFDIQSALLSEAIPSLQNTQYLKEYAFFYAIREILLQDQGLIQDLQNTDIGKKLMVINEKLNIIIKKRRNNHIHDLYAWELSYLLGSEKYVLPSFPMEIGGVRVIVQKLEAFEFGNYEGGGYTQGTLKNVSLETYWKAHIFSFISGLSDLAVANIGVNSKGIIRYFDNESCLVYFNTPFRTEVGFSTGFICQSFDWKQFNAPLDKATARNLRKYIRSFDGFEADLETYLLFRPVFLPMDGVQYRLNILRNFDVHEGYISTN
jgi:hypothetical protein